jgi:hypothetical protein
MTLFHKPAVLIKIYFLCACVHHSITQAMNGILKSFLSTINFSAFEVSVTTVYDGLSLTHWYPKFRNNDVV